MAKTLAIVWCIVIKIIPTRVVAIIIVVIVEQWLVPCMNNSQTGFHHCKSNSYHCQIKKEAKLHAKLLVSNTVAMNKFLYFGFLINIKKLGVTEICFENNFKNRFQNVTRLEVFPWFWWCFLFFANY